MSMHAEGSTALQACVLLAMCGRTSTPINALLVALAATALARMQTAGDLTFCLVNISMKNQRDIAKWRRHIEVNTAIDDAAYYGADASVPIRATGAARRSPSTWPSWFPRSKTP